METKIKNCGEFIFATNTVQLPLTVWLKPNGELVDSMEIGDKDYAEAIEYTMQITTKSGTIDIDYYGEDETYLSNVHDNWATVLIDNLSN
jgi:hypothetical protein